MGRFTGLLLGTAVGDSLGLPTEGLGPRPLVPVRNAVFLADRIVVMTARPGRIKASIDVPHPHPRSPDFMLTEEFSRIRNDLYALQRDEIRATVARMREARDAQG